MFKLKRYSGRIKNYMVLLIIIFVIASILSNIFFFNAVNTISIESELYQKIKASKDLKADFLPPKLYIVDSYLIIYQIINEKDEAQIQRFELKLAEGREEYFKYYEYWKVNIHDEALLRLLFASHTYVSEFYKVYDDKFLPALQSKNNAVLREIVDSEMNILFEKHRAVMNEMSSISDIYNAEIEKEAKISVDSSQFWLLLSYVVSVCIILLISLIILKRVAYIETSIVASQHEAKMANERLEAIVDGLKKVKHGYDNNLASINGYVLENDVAGLTNYLDEVITEKSKNETVNYFKLEFVKNPAVTGLVVSKMLYAERLGVEFALQVRSDVTKLGIKSSHLCELLGILLDNAIEAARESKAKQVYFKIDESAEAFMFEIKNSVDILPDRNKIFEKGWTTKGENRGLGLWIAADIIAKYDNVILNSAVTMREVNFFEQELMVLKKHFQPEGEYFTDIL